MPFAGPGDTFADGVRVGTADHVDTFARLDPLLNIAEHMDQAVVVAQARIDGDRYQAPGNTGH